VVVSRSVAGSPGHERLNGVQVERVARLPLSRSTLIGRAFSDLSLYLMLFLRLLRLPPADITVMMTQPPMLLVMGPLLKWIKGGRIIHCVHDIYPDLLVELGLLSRRSPVTSLLATLSGSSLRRYEQVVALGTCMRDRLIDLGVPDTHIRVIPSWSDPERVFPVPRHDNPLPREWNVENRKVVMYSGNFGHSHPMQVILDAAEQFRKRDDVAFVLIGGGPRRAELEREAARRGLTNVTLLPLQPRERLALSLSAADIHLTLLEPRLCGLVVPSKVYGVLSAGRPCLFLGPAESEVARLIRELDCGEALDNTDGPQLAERLSVWLDDPDRCAEAGTRARRYAETHGVNAAADAFQDMFASSPAISGNP
jgi:glycosyltransferase involved in cell wall biosynthesis